MQEQDRHLVYPADAQQEVLAKHASTQTTTLVDVFAMTDRNASLRCDQILAKLAAVQMQIAQVKMLNIEQCRMAEVDDASLLRADPSKARLAPALERLHATSREFTLFLALF